MDKNEITELSSELTYRNYLMNKGKVRDLFHEISIPEYIILHIIAAENENAPGCSGRVYLKDLAEKMQLKIQQASRMVGSLNDRGLLLWSHDGNGSEGTYVTITECGRTLLNEQEQRMKEYYGRVIGKFGKENLIELLRLTKQLDTIMGSEIEEMEAENELSI